MSGFEKLQFDHAQILYILDLGLKKCFYENFIRLPRFHEKTLGRSGDIDFFSREKDVHVHSPLSFMDKVLIEERQLMKWARIFQVGIFRVGIFSGGIFLEPS